MQLMAILRSVSLFFVASVLSPMAAAAADPLDQWHEVRITGNIPKHVIRHAQEKWLGLKWRSASNGIDASFLLASTNGRDWITQTVFESSYLTDMEFGDGL